MSRNPRLQRANKRKPHEHQNVIVFVRLGADDYFLSHSDRELEQTILIRCPIPSYARTSRTYES